MDIGLDERSKYLRRMVVDALASARRGHIGPSMSLIEIVRVLYDDFLKCQPDNPNWPERDRCILSKGHGCLALYAILADKGFFPCKELLSFCEDESRLGGHPERGKTPGVEASTGSLGHGLSIGVGMAIASRIKGVPYRVTVITGDGELNEGSNWEAALSCAKHQLDNLTVFIDYNKMQCYGSTLAVVDLEPLADKLQSFGFAVTEVDGHDVCALRDVVQSLPLRQYAPTAVICNTVKGKGIPFAENNPAWHYRFYLSDEDIQAMRSNLV